MKFLICLLFITMVASHESYCDRCDLQLGCPSDVLIVNFEYGKYHLITYKSQRDQYLIIIEYLEEKIYTEIRYKEPTWLYFQFLIDRFDQLLSHPDVIMSYMDDGPRYFLSHDHYLIFVENSQFTIRVYTTDLFKSFFFAYHYDGQSLESAIKIAERINQKMIDLYDQFVPAVELTDDILLGIWWDDVCRAR